MQLTLKSTKSKPRDENLGVKIGGNRVSGVLFDVRKCGNIEISKVRLSSCLSKSLQSKYRLQIKTDIQILNPLESLDLMSRVKAPQVNFSGYHGSFKN